MYCVIKVNLTKKFGQIECTGLRPKEAYRIATDLTNERILFEETRPTEFKRDKVRYIVSSWSLIDYAVKYFIETN